MKFLCPECNGALKIVTVTVVSELGCDGEVKNNLDNLYECPMCGFETENLDDFRNLKSVFEDDSLEDYLSNLQIAIAQRDIDSIVNILSAIHSWTGELNEIFSNLLE